jgi:hypothetical protein
VRTLRYVPLVFFVGIDGFAMFAPYVVMLFLTGYVVARLRNGRKTTTAAIEVEADEPTLLAT